MVGVIPGVSAAFPVVGGVSPRGFANIRNFFKVL